MKAKTLLLHMLLVVLCLITIYPVLWVVGLALSPSQDLAHGILPLPADPTLQNFRELVTATDSAGRLLFVRQLGNSLLVATLTTAVGLLLSVTAAYAMSRWSFPGRKLGLTGLLATQMFPATMMSIPLYAILDKLRLLNSVSGLVLVYATTAVPFCVWMLKGYFDTIPRELEEAALLDGASQGQIFRKVVLPLARPALAVTALFSFMTAWNEFILAATFQIGRAHV